MSSDSDLVVVGAGPSGLALALQATMMGAKVRVVERRTEPSPSAPALAIHPRTMEILRGLDVADEIVARGLSRVDLSIHVGTSVIAGSLADLRLPRTEYPFILFAPQPVLETVLRDRLASMGVSVEWGSELAGFDAYEDGVRCRIRHREKPIVTRYLAGCDGAESTVRRVAGTRFRGRSYRESIVVADAGPVPDLVGDVAHAFLGTRGILFFFPLPAGSWRVIGPGRSLTSTSDVRALVDRHTAGSVTLGDVDWFKVIRPQHRIADSYRSGSVFLVGDAAHVHSPAGAQGMNTGIQDAANLGWKLGMVLRGSPESLLDTYGEERRPVARQVVRLTGLAFALEVSEFAPLRWGRRRMARPIARLLLPRPRLLSGVARVVSGLDTRYRKGALDPDRVSCRRYGAGRRLPDFPIDDPDFSRLHRVIDPRGFTLVKAGGVDRTESEQLSRRHGELVSTHELGAGAARHMRSVSWVLVRPDGYIATAGTAATLDEATRFLDRWVGHPAAVPKPLRSGG